MAAKLLLISNRPDDQAVWQAIAQINHLELIQTIRLTEIETIVSNARQLIVIWDGDLRPSVAAIGEVLSKFVKPAKVFVVTDGPLNSYQELFSFPAFGHHLMRRYASPAPILFSKLIMASTTSYPFGLERFVPSGSAIQKITLKKSSHKALAIQAVQNVLEKQSVAARLASSVAQAMDEIIMNAIFDAPTDAKGKHYQKGRNKTEDFDLTDREAITLSLCDAREYIAIQVADPFGSLEKEVVMRFLRHDFQAKPFIEKKTEGAASLGLNGILQTGMSILFVVRPGERTEISLFVRKSQSFKAFRESFRFVSIMAE